MTSSSSSTLTRSTLTRSAHTRVRRLAVGLAVTLMMPGASGAQAPPETWLDRPLTGWNSAGAAVPTPARSDESREETVTRCQLTPPRATSAEQRIGDAGWIVFHNFDRQLVKDDVEIVGGMTGADGMCRPTGYNLFVFVGGRFAGTLSPIAMSSRADASSGTVRLLAGDVISVDFSRYASSDALCCPSGQLTIRYAIDRSGSQPVVTPTERRVRR